MARLPSVLTSRSLRLEEWLLRLRAPVGALQAIRKMRVGERYLFGECLGPGYLSVQNGEARAELRRERGQWMIEAAWGVRAGRRNRPHWYVCAPVRIMNAGMIEFDTIDNETRFALVCRYLEWIVSRAGAKDMRQFARNGMEPFWRGETIDANNLTRNGVLHGEIHCAAVLFAMRPELYMPPLSLPRQFAAVILWECGDYLLKITLPNFARHDEARRFAHRHYWLKVEGDCLLLIDAQRSIEAEEAFDEHVALYRRRTDVAPETRRNDDYEQILVTISQLRTHVNVMAMTRWLSWVDPVQRQPSYLLEWA